MEGCGRGRTRGERRGAEWRQRRPACMRPFSVDCGRRTATDTRSGPPSDHPHTHTHPLVVAVARSLLLRLPLIVAPTGRIEGELSWLIGRVGRISLSTRRTEARATGKGDSWKGKERNGRGSRRQGMQAR
jgi:hypothetical protein